MPDFQKTQFCACSTTHCSDSISYNSIAKYQEAFAANKIVLYFCYQSNLSTKASYSSLQLKHLKITINYTVNHIPKK